MFRKLMKRTALYQIAVIGAVLIVVFAFSCIYNYDRMNTNVDRKVSAFEKVGAFFPENGSNFLDRDEQRNTLLIRVFSNGKYKISDISFYEEETILKIINKAKEGKDKILVDGNNIAYSLIENGGDVFYTLYIYDYTGEYNAFVTYLLTMLITCVTVMAVVVFFVTRFTKRNLSPIENAFIKQKELVANASHELKTPLTIINTNISILNSSADEMTEEHRKWLNGISVQVNRMSTMINEMLELAKFEAMREKDFVKVNFSEIVESVVLETEVMAYEKNIIIESNINKGIYIFSKSADMEKLVFILIENALKYTKAYGKISVSLASERHKAVLKVKNTGDGISREMMPKLFDRFYRCDESHSESGSFGLGLSIAKAIVDANNGSIGVDSKQGNYTEFIVYMKETN